jgi:hypothetical protein
MDLRNRLSLRARKQTVSTPARSTVMVFTVVVVTVSDETQVVTYPRLREAMMYASVIMNSGGDATEVLVFCLTEGTSTLVKRYRRDNV